MVRKAFKRATTELPGATFVVVPEDVAERRTDAPVLRVNVPVDPRPTMARCTGPRTYSPAPST